MNGTQTSFLPGIQTPGQPGQVQAGDFSVIRSGEAISSHTLQEVIPLAQGYRLLPDDQIHWKPQQTTLVAIDFEKLARLLRSDDLLFHMEKDLMLTRHALISKGKRIPWRDLLCIELILPEPAREKVHSKIERTLIWSAAVVLCWTIVVPIVAWYLTRQTTNEEGLGAVHGIRCRTREEELIIHEGLGILPPGSPEAESLARLHRQMEELRRQ